MHIPFNASEGASLGIEVELEIVDRASRELASAATSILTELGAGHPGGEHPKAKHELFECTIEIITGICTTVAEARDDLQGTLKEVAAPAERRGLALLCSGTHPFSDWHDQQISPDPRYHWTNDVERYCWNDMQTILAALNADASVKSNSPAGVARVWGLAPPPQ